MAHLEKYTASVTGHMFAHYDRLHPGKESEIDETRTRLNYNLAANDQPLSQQDFLKKRLSEIKVMKRADVNVMCDWIVTAPEKLNPEEHEKFFREVYAFLNNRYGKENVISAYVHMDETTPHVHYAFVPVVTDKKKSILKLSAKERITKGDLKSFHSDLTKRMTEIFGRDIGILNSATVNGNLTPKQMKRLEADMQNFQTVPIEEVTYRIPRAIGEGNVVVKRTELDRVNRIAAEAQYILENQTALNTQSTEIRKRADSTLTSAEEKGEQIITAAESKAAEVVTEAESRAAEIMANAEYERNDAEMYAKKVKQRAEEVQKKSAEVSKQEVYNKAAAEKNAAKAAEIERREQACEDKERALDERTDRPDKYYREYYDSIVQDYVDTIQKKNKIISSLTNSVTDYQSNLAEEHRKYEDMERQYKEEISAVTKAKDAVIENLNKTVAGLKEKLSNAFKTIRDICVGVAALAYGIAGSGKDEFVADLTDEQTRLVNAILNLGAKKAKAEDFGDYANEISTTRGVRKAVRAEYDLLEPAPVKSHDDFSL